MTIDGDTSTNDTVLLMANGAAEAGPIVPGSEGAQLFAEALNQVCVHLAKAIAREGEGSTKLIEVIVEGGQDHAAGPERRPDNSRVQPGQERQSMATTPIGAG